MNVDNKKKIEFGDFQTPFSLAQSACARLKEIGVKPDIIVEPTCGVGAFLFSSLDTFKESKKVLGFEIDSYYMDALKDSLEEHKDKSKVDIKQGDFFNVDWVEELLGLNGDLLVVGNFPWVTNSGIGAIGGSNLPTKSNFLKRSGFDSISGKANFDISEWMMLEVMSWFEHRNGSIAMLLKTAVARKVLSHAKRQQANLVSSFIYKIDAKKEFNASVDSCFLIMNFDSHAEKFVYDYEVFDNLNAKQSHTVGYRSGFTISYLTLFDKYSYLFGTSPIKWRSGVKHDCSSVMELTRINGHYENRLGEKVSLENEFIYPLLKGSDVGSDKKWREKFVLVTQKKVGENTSSIASIAPKTWQYLNSNKEVLDARGSVIYAKNPQFSVFGVGDYAFNDWKIAICALYKNLEFRLVEPIENKAVMFDDTVYYVSFKTREEAEDAFLKITSKEGTEFLKSLIFLDEKRPVKTSLLNAFDWTKVQTV